MYVIYLCEIAKQPPKIINFIYISPILSDTIPLNLNHVQEQKTDYHLNLKKKTEGVEKEEDVGQYCLISFSFTTLFF